MLHTLEAMTSDTEQGQASAPEPPAFDSRFVRRTILVLALIAFMALLVQVSDVLLLVFGAVVVATLLRALVDPLHRHTFLGEGVALAVSVAALLACLALTLWLFGQQITAQIGMLIDTVPSAARQILDQMDNNALGRRVAEQIRAAGEESSMITRVPGIAVGAISGGTTLVVVFVAGVMLAAKPQSYREGMVLLVPGPARPAIRAALNRSGKALSLWLLGQFVAMAVIGVLTGLGLMLAGVPSPLALGLFAGLAQFVPLVGPIVSAIPGLILAASEGPDVLLWALAVYVGVQQFESNLLTPIVEKRAASLPMPITLFAVLAFGALFGLPGVVLATPLAVVLYVLVKMLYIQNVLGDQVTLPGRKSGD